MFGKGSLLNGVVSLVLLGFATGIIAEMDTGTKTVYIGDVSLVNRSLRQDTKETSMHIADEKHKKLQIDNSVLAEIMNPALEERYGEKKSRVVDIYFPPTILDLTYEGDYKYWGSKGVYYRLGSDIEYIKVPVDLRLRIDGQVISRRADCQWEVFFRAGERWENISVNTMRISSCSHPDIDFTSNVLVDILSERLDDIFLYPDIETERETEKRFTL